MDFDPDSPDPERLRRLRQRLLERMADAETSHLTVQAWEGPWQPFAPGVRMKLLHERDGIRSYLLQLAAGARLPAHRHPREEECLVLEGTLRVGTALEVPAGGWHLAHAGSLHATLSTDVGATVFLRGAVPDASQCLSDAQGESRWPRTA